MAWDRSLYPKNWSEIRDRILTRAGGRCEWEGCGVLNGALGARDRYGEWHDRAAIDNLNCQDGEWLFDGGYPKLVRIVLTVAHVVDPDPSNCSDDNLKALCQLHHNKLDAPMRAKHAAETRRRKRLALQPELLGAVAEAVS